MVHNGISNQATLNLGLVKFSSEKDLTMWKYSFTYAKEINKLIRIETIWRGQGSHRLMKIRLLIKSILENVEYISQVVCRLFNVSTTCNSKKLRQYKSPQESNG